MCNALQVLCEGNKDVKKSKNNMLKKKYKLLCMEPDETIESMQARFLHLINKLKNLGKSLSKMYYANNTLRSMCTDWQPKVITIKESNDINNLDIIQLFGKMTEHEINSKAKEEEIGLFIKRYNKYIKKHKLKHCGKILMNFKKRHAHKKEDNFTVGKMSNVAEIHDTCP